jgi:hexosaminidase
VTPQFPNMSALVMNLYYPQLPVGRSLTKGLTSAEVDAVGIRLDEIRTLLTQARSERADAARVMDEVVFSIDLVSLLARDLQARLAVDGHIGSVPQAERARLEQELDGVMERYRSLWLERNRPGGLEDSLAWLSNLKNAYATGHPDPDWGGISLR